MSGIAKQLNNWLAAVLCAVALLTVAGAHARQASPAALPAIEVQALPPEARAALERIERGGPHPYRKDGSVFANRERRLPDRPRGYYREYTVPTPGERDRGARRIVAGSAGERYYTADHYRTFRRIVP